MSIKRERGIALTLALITAAVAAAAAVGVIAWDKSRIKSADEAGYARAKQEVKAEASAALNRSLLNQREQIITLNEDLTIAHDEYTRTKDQLDVAHAAARKSGERVRNAATAGDELERRVAAADLGAVRTFATGSFRTAQACRDVVAEAGFGAGGLVESSAAHRAEKQRADALMKFSMPSTPFTKPKESP